MLDSVKYVYAEQPWFFAICVFIFGACWGSFLNVVIYRVPKKQSVVSPRSYCTTSNKPIPWYDNIPLLSWLMLRGKSRHDGQPISIRYPAVELLTGVLFLAAWLMQPPLIALAGFPFIALLIAGTFIDLEHMILPDFATVWGMLVGIALSFAVPALHGYTGEAPYSIEALRSALSAVIGAFIGSALILWIAVLAETILKREAMGFGDVLFMGCIGAFCGWKGAIFAVFGGALVGTVIVIPMMIIQKVFGIQAKALGRVENRTMEEITAAEEAEAKGEVAEKSEAEDDKNLKMGTAIPFGPWLALGALIYYIFMREPVDDYFENLKYMLFVHAW